MRQLERDERQRAGVEASIRDTRIYVNENGEEVPDLDGEPGAQDMDIDKPGDGFA